METVVKDASLKAFEQDKKIDLLNKKFGVLREKESDLQEKYKILLEKVDKLEKSLVDTISVEKMFKEKDNEVDNLVNSMLEKFRKLEERLYSIEDKETEHEISYCERGDNFNKSQSNLNEHEKILDGRNSETVIETVENEEIYKCEVCDFTTAHNP